MYFIQYMNKWLYILMNIVAVCIALALLIFGALPAKVLGLFGLIIIGKEIISGNYKGYIN